MEVRLWEKVGIILLLYKRNIFDSRCRQEQFYQKMASHSAIFAIAASVLLQACVYVPITKEVYDADCRIISKHMELQPVQIAAINRCSHNDCVVILAAATATAATSAVISGSIVVAGNVVYWFEKQGQCKKGIK